ncbi:MAG: hypothetical protein Q9166_006114 [cf. Caloplaca sp. 2 TL-2023]
MVLVRTVGEKLLNDLWGPVVVSAQASASLSDLVSRRHNEGLAEVIEEIKAQLILDQLRVDFKVLDVENGVGEVDDVLAAGSFDLVIIHKAFRKQTTALKATRSVLKPGGFLLMMAATGDTLRFPFFLLSAPPPVTEEDGLVKPKFPNATREETHSILRDAGFSGVDSIALDNVPEKHTFSVVVSQALDDQISFLKAPLASKLPVATSGKLVILGGYSLKVANLIQVVQGKLSRIWDGEIVNVETLADLESLETDKVENVLSLTELDRPVLDRLRAPTFQSLQLLLEMSKTVLWVTQGARSESPYQSGTIGLGRSFQSENPQKLLQFLDLDTLDGGESFVAESLFRLIGGVVMRDNGSKRSHLWNIEPELAVEIGSLLIPRLLPDVQRNHRLSSLKRIVETQALIGTQPVSLVRSLHNAGENVYAAEEALHHQSNLAEFSTGSDQISLRVDYRSKDPVMPNYHGKDLFCCVGRTQQGMRFSALSVSNSSVIAVPRAWTVRLDDEELQDTMVLPVFVRVLNEIKLRVIEKSMPAGYTTLLYGSDIFLAASLDRRKNMSDKDFAYIGYQAQSTRGCLPSGHIEFGLHTSRKELKSMLPPRTRLLIQLGYD